MPPRLTCELVEKIVNIVVFGTDLLFLDNISFLVAKIDCELVAVLVDSEIQHFVVSVGLQSFVVKTKSSLRETSFLRPQTLFTGGVVLNIILHDGCHQKLLPCEYGLLPAHCAGGTRRLFGFETKRRKDHAS
jgi:hypothetical protein